MGDMTTLNPNESLRDHANKSLEQLTELINLTSILETRDPDRIRFSVKVDLCKAEFGYIIQHIRESIESLNDLCDELDDDLREVRKAYADDMECIRKYGTQSVDAEKLFEQLKEDCEHFRLLAISRNKELEREREKSNQLEETLKDTTITQRHYRDTMARIYNAEREKSNQLEAQVKELQYRYDELKKECSNWKDLCITWQKESAKDYKRSNQLEKHCKDLEHRLKEEHERHMKLREDTDSVEVNDPANFCGNCKHFVVLPNNVGTCNNKRAKPFIVDPDDASCPHFESNQVDRDKPDNPCCEACNRDDCDDCTLCPF